MTIVGGDNEYLGGGFEHFLFSSLFGEDSHFDSYFSNGLKPPTRYNYWDVRFCCYLLLNPGFFGFITFSECLTNENTQRYQELIVFFLKQKDGRQTWRCSQDISSLKISMYRLEILPWYCRFWSLDNWRGTFSKDLSKLAILRINAPLLILGGPSPLVSS